MNERTDNDQMNLRDRFALSIVPKVFEAVMAITRGDDEKTGESYIDDLADGDSDGSLVALASYALADAMMRVRSEKLSNKDVLDILRSGKEGDE